MNRYLALAIVPLLFVTHAQAGGRCRVVQRFAAVAVAAPEAYYSVQQTKAAPFVYSGDVDAILKADAEVKRLESGLATQQVSHEQKMQQIQQSLYQLRAYSQQRICVEPGQASPPPEPTPADPAAAAGGNLDAEVAAIFTRRQCGVCHGGQGKGGINLLSGAQLTQQARDISSCILGEVFTGKMPKGMPDHQLPDEELQKVYEWASQQK